MTLRSGLRVRAIQKKRRSRVRRVEPKRESSTDSDTEEETEIDGEKILGRTKPRMRSNRREVQEGRHLNKRKKKDTKRHRTCRF